MAETKMTTMRAVESLNRGGIIFADELDSIVRGNLDGMVANSELGRCHHSDFVFYFAWRQSENQCVADVANKIAEAMGRHQ